MCENLRAEGTIAVRADIKLKGSSSDFVFIFQKNIELVWKEVNSCGDRQSCKMQLGMEILKQY